MNSRIETLLPPKLSTILDVYMKIKKRQNENKDLRIPIITLYLNNAYQLRGRILNCDFVTGRLAFLVTTPEGSLDVSVLDIASITSVTLHDLDLCDEFLHELASRD